MVIFRNENKKKIPWKNSFFILIITARRLVAIKEI